uniref:Minor capsid protein n=1 Tax=Gokushovirinae environmental samples TaxID=1478972 RepID=A0A2R3UAI7_9VIRU|nr:minor capsid protein [Gokushovirinae environmental samples]
MNEQNIAMQRETNQMNINENQKNRDFQEQMSNTAYQRASQDMKSAGLNPMMMFGSGSAASSPTGGVPNLQAPKNDVHSGMSQMGDAVGKAVSSAIGLKTFDKMTQEIANLQTQQALTSAVTKTEEEKPAKLRAETATERERPANIRAQTFNTDTATAREANRMPVSRLEGSNAEDILAMPDWLRRTLNVGAYSGGKVGDAVAPLLNSARRAKSLFSY